MSDYKGRPADYDPETACATKRRRVWSHSLLTLVCDLAKGHDGDRHRTVIDDETMIYWKGGPDDPEARTD